MGFLGRLWFMACSCKCGRCQKDLDYTSFQSHMCKLFDLNCHQNLYCFMLSLFVRPHMITLVSNPSVTLTQLILSVIFVTLIVCLHGRVCTCMYQLEWCVTDVMLSSYINIEHQGGTIYLY